MSGRWRATGMRSIGEIARESGLTVSALRFYDREGVFGPAWVDPDSGYRWYAAAQVAEATLLARLRGIGLPLAGIRRVLAAEPGAAAAREVLDAHVRRLEAGLSDARREIAALRALLDRPDGIGAAPTTLTLRAADLAGGLAAVRFAAADRPRRPVPAGVLFDVTGGRPDGGAGGAGVLRLAATDRHRLAVARVAVRGRTGPAASAVVPPPVVDGMRALLTGADEVTLTLDGSGPGGAVTLRSAGRTLAGPGADRDFPDYRPLTRIDAAARARFRPAALRAQVLAAGEPTVVLTHDAAGRIAVRAGHHDEGPNPVRVNRGYLLEAIAAGSPRHLLLELSGPRSPMAIRDADDPHRFSILMPIAPAAEPDAEPLDPT